MKHSLSAAALSAALMLLIAAPVASAAPQVNVVCSMNPEWCRNAAAIYPRLHGVQVNVINKPTGESCGGARSSPGMASAREMRA